MVYYEIEECILEVRSNQRPQFHEKLKISSFMFSSEIHIIKKMFVKSVETFR